MSDEEEPLCAPVSDYALYVRCYAPFPSFGGGFEGDNRGPSTSAKATSRIEAAVKFNPQTGKVGAPGAVSSGTKWMPGNVSRMARPRVQLVSARRVADGISLQFDVAGSNPVLDPLSPDIDVHVTGLFALRNGFFIVQAQMRGDRFPNAEMFVADSADQRRMLVTYETTSGALTGPVFSLPGNGKLPMTSICVGFPVDARGYFR